MRLVLDRERCVGAGLCALSTPEYFDQSEEDGRVQPRPDAYDAPADRVRVAVGLCPSRAISLVEDRMRP